VHADKILKGNILEKVLSTYKKDKKNYKSSFFKEQKEQF
jgi:hypothetical protein